MTENLVHPKASPLLWATSKWNSSVVQISLLRSMIINIKSSDYLSEIKTGKHLGNWADMGEGETESERIREREREK